jgi:hypothetical protein
MKLILSFLAFLPLLLVSPLGQAVEDAAVRKAPPVDPWGIALFLGVIAIALSWFIWKLRRSASKDREQDKQRAE